jgi:hypothetical protein
MAAPKGQIPWNKGKETKPRTGKVNQYGGRKSDNEVFVSESTYPRHRLKERIIKQSLIPYQCDCCGIGPEWQGKPMPLILDHINGINNDNRIKNLRFVCSNCDSQLPTYKSRNLLK